MDNGLVLDEFLAVANFDRDGNQRRGQAFFNNLHEVRPDLAERIRMLDLDPFYADSHIPVATAWLRTHWGRDVR